MILLTIIKKWRVISKNMEMKIMYKSKLLRMEVAVSYY